MLTHLLFVSLQATQTVGAHPRPVAKMVYIQNRQIKLGVDLNVGGSIAYLAPVDKPDLNVINGYDSGRQVQLSFYSGPIPFKPAGTEVSKQWEYLGWNPIQSGDAYGNSSRIVASKIERDRLYIRCIPMHWPLKNYPGECQFEVWLKLDGPTVIAKCRLLNARPDKVQYPARNQELPAVYVNAPYHHLISYTGNEPFTEGPTTEIHNRLDQEGRWAHWLGTEKWACQLDESGFGLGIYNPSAFAYNGGFYGEPGVGGASDKPTGYIAPLRNEVLDHNIQYEFKYVLILGSMEQVRGYAYAHRGRTLLPSWIFRNSRQGWNFDNGRDGGWPIRDAISCNVSEKPLLINGPDCAVPASAVSEIEVEATFKGRIDLMNLNVQTNLEPILAKPINLSLPVLTDGKRHRYTYKIGPLLQSNSLITKLQLNLKCPPGAIAEVRLSRVTIK